MVDTNTETSATWYQWPNIWDFSKMQRYQFGCTRSQWGHKPGEGGGACCGRRRSLRHMSRRSSCYNSFLLLTNVPPGLLAVLSNLVNFTSDDTCDVYDSATNSAFRDTVWGIRLVNWSPRATDFLPANCVNDRSRACVCFRDANTAPCRKLPMDFEELCTFESYRQHWSHYGYGGNFQDVVEQEFTRTKGRYGLWPARWIIVQSWPPSQR